MSSDAFWEPVTVQPKNLLPFGFKKAISPVWFGHDGSLSRGPDSYVIFDEKILRYFQGVIDTHPDDEAVEGAQILCQAIRKFGAVKVWIE